LEADQNIVTDQAAPNPPTVDTALAEMPEALSTTMFL